MKKLAIIGASIGQLELCKKAKKHGIYTICFAWEKGAICKDFVDKFYPISITEKEEILKICRQEKIDGVVSNTSEKTAGLVAFIAESMNLNGVKESTIYQIKNKSFVRTISQNINELKQIRFHNYTYNEIFEYPCVIKPITGAGKAGVSFAQTQKEFNEAILYAKNSNRGNFFIEEFIPGREISVETLSFHNTHYVIQVTDKESSGAPHFLELSHHQPAELNKSIYDKIQSIVSQLLEKLEFHNGAAHIEMKIDNDQNIYLIEVNPRGGGDMISNKLVELSSKFDYVYGMIQVALNCFEFSKSNEQEYSGIYFLSEQTKNRIPFFKKIMHSNDCVECTMNFDNESLKSATGNGQFNGYIIYKSSKPIIFT